MDHDAAWIKMQQGSRCYMDQDVIWIKMQNGSGCNEDPDAAWIKMQRGSRCIMDENATRNEIHHRSAAVSMCSTSASSSFWSLFLSQPGIVMAVTNMSFVPFVNFEKWLEWYGSEAE